MKGDRSEDHLAAVCWNVMAMMHFEETGQAEEWNNYPAYKRTDGGHTIHLPTCATHPSVPPPPPPPAPKPADPYRRDYKIIAVDFDGCLCTNAWPEIGEPNTKLIYRLKFRRAHGDKLILWTCREGDKLREAVEWCRKHHLEFDAVNENLPEMNALYGNDSRKIGADRYIDDKAERVTA
jgi:hypothetical protein